ncbi:hypothetical protein CesoFtcFv8_003113 [Champsocephalus esox]|uniref:Uncharacterized protein n=1 Tax=Champsocephalus esox TaxID=159716 RepID=A0AAN8HE30_9TELE|nr:hypothetical protein CesoFtcFv8_003113 [Champsocephalus esox]
MSGRVHARVEEEDQALLTCTPSHPAMHLNLPSAADTHLWVVTVVTTSCCSEDACCLLSSTRCSRMGLSFVAHVTVTYLAPATEQRQARGSHQHNNSHTPAPMTCTRSIRLFILPNLIHI